MEKNIKCHKNKNYKLQYKIIIINLLINNQ